MTKIFIQILFKDLHRLAKDQGDFMIHFKKIKCSIGLVCMMLMLMSCNSNQRIVITEPCYVHPISSYAELSNFTENKWEPLSSQESTVDLTSVSDGILLVNNSTHEVVYSKNMNKKMFPASMTKVMTALIAIEQGHLSDMVKISKNATKINGSQCDLKENDQLSLEQLLYGLLVHSGNDNAIAIAQYISGSEKEFIKLMNVKARQLGAYDTHFINPHGLHDELHYTTPYDMYLIFKEALKYQTIRTMIHTKAYTAHYYDEDKDLISTTWENTNQFFHLDGSLEGMWGGKTGFTTPAGYNLVLLTFDRSEEYISVVMKAPTLQTLYNETQLLFEEVLDTSA